MSTLKADTIQNTSGGAATLTKQHAAKAWADYQGSGTTFSDSFNCASAVDNNTGDYTINLTNSMGSGNFSLTGTLSASQVGDEYTLTFLSTDTSANSRRVFSSTNYEPGSANGSPRDNITNVVFHGDLA